MILWSKSQRLISGWNNRHCLKEIQVQLEPCSSFWGRRYLKERWGIPPESCLKIPFSPASTDYYSLCSTNFLFLSFWRIRTYVVCVGVFFSPLALLFWVHSFWSFCLIVSLYGKMLGKELSFSDNSIDHCHKILKVEKNALAAQKETGPASWCCIVTAHQHHENWALTTFFHSHNMGGRMLGQISASTCAPSQCDLMSHPCPAQSWAAFSQSGGSRRLRTGGCI